MNLYWWEIDDHDEDWFIVAESEDEACYVHEEEEGYGPRAAITTLLEFLLRSRRSVAPVRQHPA